MNIINKLFKKKPKTRLFTLNVGYHITWHSFLDWWVGKNSYDNYAEIVNNKEKYIISEYPDGTLQVLDTGNTNTMYSGIWFYIDDCKIRLFEM